MTKLRARRAWRIKACQGLSLTRSRGARSVQGGDYGGSGGDPERAGVKPQPSPPPFPLSPLRAQLKRSCPSACRHHHRHHPALAQARKRGPATPAPRAAPARRRPGCQPPPRLHGQPRVRLAAASACSPGTAATSGFGSHLFFQSGPSHQLSASRRRASDATTRRPRAGPGLGGGGPRMRTGRARQSAGSGSVLPSEQTLVHTACSSPPLPVLAEGKACHLPGVCDIPSAASCCGSSGEGNRTARRGEDDRPTEKNTSSYKTAQVGKDAGHTEAHEVRTYGRAHRSLLWWFWKVSVFGNKGRVQREC